MRLKIAALPGIALALGIAFVCMTADRGFGR